MKYTLSLIFFLSLGQNGFPDTCSGVFTFAKAFKKYEKNLEGLDYLAIKYGDRGFLKDELEYYPYPYLDIPRPVANKDKPDTVKISELHFMQRSTKLKSSSNKGGYSVIDNAKKLQTGELSADDFPRIEVWQDKTGKIWTVDHRRLAAMVLSGVIKKVPVIWISPKQVLNEEREKFWPIKKGRRTKLIDYKNNTYILITTKP